MSPLSAAVVTSPRPRLGVAPSVGHTARIEICRDRACADVIVALDATAPRTTVAHDLPAGSVFWRATGYVNGCAVTAPSATWNFYVPQRPYSGGAVAPSAWGSRLDVNGDGFSDLLLGNTVLVGGGNGVQVQGPVPGTFPYFPANGGDLNGDGFSDIVRINQDPVTGFTYSLFTYFGGASGLSTGNSLIDVESVFGSLGTQSAAGDINGDGFGDFLVKFRGGERTFFGGAGGLSNFQEPGPGLASQGRFGVNGDVNGDGFSDAIATWINGDRAWYVPGTASGYSMTPTTIPLSTGTSPAAALLADVNGDGFADALISLQGGQVAVFSGGASGIAIVPSQVLTAGAPGAADLGPIDAGDFNGDGYVDLAAQRDTGALVFFGAAGGLGAVPVAVGAGLTGFLQVGDVDRDAFDDLAILRPSVGADSSTADIFRGSPTGFAAAPDQHIVVPAAP